MEEKNFFFIETIEIHFLTNGLLFCRLLSLRNKYINSPMISDSFVFRPIDRIRIANSRILTCHFTCVNFSFEAEVKDKSIVYVLCSTTKLSEVGKGGKTSSIFHPPNLNNDLNNFWNLTEPYCLFCLKINAIIFI